jgi:putative endonuclease
MGGSESGGTGRRGEDAAANFLNTRGYTIIFRNFRTRFGEIDIIATTSDYIVFAEVKTRAHGSMLLPREAVDIKKQKRIIMATQMYLASHNIGRLQPRFDVIEVITHGASDFEVESINHIENAFTL